MENIKNFNSFANEGLKSWINKKMNPKELDSLIKDIIYDIKINFNIDNLSAGDGLYRNVFTYTTSKNDIIKVIGGYEISINGEDFTELVNKNYIKDIQNLLLDKYENKKGEELKKYRSDKAYSLKDRYSNKYNTPLQGDYGN